MASSNDAAEAGSSPVPRVPRYVEIYTDIAEKIRTGSIAMGHQFPTQRALSRHYGVSLMTLRQALRALADDGLVVARQGDGTYVAQHRYAYDPSRLQSFVADMTAQGTTVETKVLSVRKMLAPAGVARRLSAGIQQRVLMIERLRYGDGVPVVLQKSYLPAELGAALDTKELRTRSLYDTLIATSKVTVARASETVLAALLTQREAQLLEQEKDSAALISHRVTFSVNGIPFLYDRAVLSGARVSITTERTAASTETRYQLDLAMNNRRQ